MRLRNILTECRSFGGKYYSIIKAEVSHAYGQHT